jgi:hypothetical protein
MNTKILAWPLAAALTVAGLTACGSNSTGGGGSSSGIGGTGATTVGTITGFGSIFVNGVEYELAGAEIEVEEELLTEDDLKLGMVVRVEGEIDDSGTTGTATRVSHDDEAEGPVTGLSRSADGTALTLTVLGTDVSATSGTTVFDGTTFDALGNDDIVEVDGFFDGAGVLHATRIEYKGSGSKAGTEVEVKGTISGFDPSAGTFTLTTRTGGSVTVAFDGTTDMDDLTTGSENGAFVEVEGTLAAADRIDAREIEVEEAEFGDDEDEVSLEGLVADYNGLDDFTIDGQAVDASGAEFEPASLRDNLADGARIEVEGAIAGGVLIADEVESRGDGDIRIHAVVTRKTSAGVEVTLAGTVVAVTTNAATQFEDERDDVSVFGLDDIAGGDFLEIEGYLADDGSVVATQVQRDESDDVVVRAPLEAFDTDAGSVTLLGATFTTDSSTEYEDDADSTLSRTDFFNALSEGQAVQVQDDLDNGSWDGIADELELED